MEQLATSIWLMDKGEILLHGDVKELLMDHPVTENGIVNKGNKLEEGMRVATLEELHDYYLGGEME